MSVIATMEVPPEWFLLERTLSEADVSARLERLVPLDERLVPYVWFSVRTPDVVEAALAADADVAAFAVIDEADDEHLVRVEWTGGVDGVISALRAANGSLLDAEGDTDGWRLQVRFDEHAHLAKFYGAARDHGCDPDVVTVHQSATQASGDSANRLTEAQHEALVTALETGYFDVPRRTNLIELADGLGISDTAASQRIRRGVETVLASSLSEPEPVDRD